MGLVLRDGLGSKEVGGCGFACLRGGEMVGIVLLGFCVLFGCNGVGLAVLFAKHPVRELGMFSYLRIRLLEWALMGVLALEGVRSVV